MLAAQISSPECPSTLTFAAFSCKSPTLAANAAAASLSATAFSALASGVDSSNSFCYASTLTSLAVLTFGGSTFYLATFLTAAACTSSAVGRSSPTSLWWTAAIFLKTEAVLIVSVKSFLSFSSLSLIAYFFAFSLARDLAWLMSALVARISVSFLNLILSSSSLSAALNISGFVS